ncbi:hypothetical protein ACF063_12285 [Streptomyces chartreusis]|uniref:hypothetical protein n=1 Tax=Streptomyces chartreusis TaxID=1969 RepID=UPI003701E91B
MCLSVDGDPVDPAEGRGEDPVPDSDPEDETAWPDNAEFRRSLRELQQNLRPYIIGLGEIAGIRDPERHLRRSAWHTTQHADGVPEQNTPRRSTPT